MQQERKYVAIMKNEAIAEKTESSIEDVRHAIGLAEKVSIPHSGIDPLTNVQTIKLDEFWIINSDTGDGTKHE